MEEEGGDTVRQQVTLRLHLNSDRCMLVLSSLSFIQSGTPAHAVMPCPPTSANPVDNPTH